MLWKAGCRELPTHELESLFLIRAKTPVPVVLGKDRIRDRCDPEEKGVQAWEGRLQLGSGKGVCREPPRQTHAQQVPPDNLRSLWTPGAPRD